jgi:hypothetical protein
MVRFSLGPHRADTIPRICIFSFFTHSLANPRTHLPHKQLLGGDETQFIRVYVKAGCDATPLRIGLPRSPESASSIHARRVPAASVACRKTGHELRFIGADAINAGTPRDALFKQITLERKTPGSGSNRLCVQSSKRPSNKRRPQGPNLLGTPDGNPHLHQMPKRPNATVRPGSLRRTLFLTLCVSGQDIPQVCGRW